MVGNIKNIYRIYFREWLSGRNMFLPLRVVSENPRNMSVCKEQLSTSRQEKMAVNLLNKHFNASNKHFNASNKHFNSSNRLSDSRKSFFNSRLTSRIICPV